MIATLPFTGKKSFLDESFRQPCCLALKCNYVICITDAISASLLITTTPNNIRGRSWTAATSKVELFVIIINNWKPLTIVTKSSTLDVAEVLDPPLNTVIFLKNIIRTLYMIRFPYTKGGKEYKRFVLKKLIIVLFQIV